MDRILFFNDKQERIIAVVINKELSSTDIDALIWLFDDAKLNESSSIEGYFIGPRKEMITPWSTTAVEITRNMNIDGIDRIEEFFKAEGPNSSFDPMLRAMYNGLNQDSFKIDKQPEPINYIEDIDSYNIEQGLALNEKELEYLKSLGKKLGRPLTDSEIFGFSQVNSEHCRHKIFNGTFIIDGVEKESSLFKLIKKTSQVNPNRIVSAYSDNCAFLEGPTVKMFHPASGDKPDYYTQKDEEIVISLKAETHNFPTTVEPFNGAATGSGGEIRDRIGGGKGSFAMAGTAAYMTSYPRFENENRPWEQTPARKWLYQTPQELLIKASNGASDFGNKFGQPLICGSLLTLEHVEACKKYGYDKVIMLAGGVGYARRKDSLKGTPSVGDKIVLMGGDNYRIGMGGGAVSSVDTGQYGNAIELNAVQRANPEMQKRVSNAIRSLAESDINPIITIHDHGAGGHLNCLSELVEATGGKIDINSLPIGDPTLSYKEIAGNESQERMGMVVHEKDVQTVKDIAAREQAPCYIIGETTGDGRFTFEDTTNGKKPIDLELKDMFGNAPKTVIYGDTIPESYSPLSYDKSKLHEYVENVVQIEAVASKDWLTNKVDRSVTGLVAMQQTSGEIQLPLNDMAIVALDYQGKRGTATSLGHAPAVAMINAAAGSRMAIAEALTNVVFAPIQDGIRGISLSANWMWPCKNEGEDARLYQAVEAASNFALSLGINIPTGKDSLSMTQKYPNGEKVLAPGSVLISSVGEVKDIRKAVRPVLKKTENSVLIYINLSQSPYSLGGSSFAQTINQVGNDTPDVANPEYFAKAFNVMQNLVEKGWVMAGHDVSAGGLITTLLEMCFGNTDWGIEAELTVLNEPDPVKVLLSENPAWVIQVQAGQEIAIRELFAKEGILASTIGKPTPKRILRLFHENEKYKFDIDALRDCWMRTSYLFDRMQSGEIQAKERYNNYKDQPLKFDFPKNFTGRFSQYGASPTRTSKTGLKAAIIREKGDNSEREMAFMMHLAGWDVKDVHMTDLISGRETLEEVNLIVFVGGFSNADVLGSAKGWAGSFLYNQKAKTALENFYARPDTMSLGICNGCQVMIHLGLITPEDDVKPTMEHNFSHKFESAFVGVKVEESPSIMLKTLENSRLGIWVSHGEGRFDFPKPLSHYNIAVRYNYNAYPANPNGSPEGVAGICSKDGRHLVMMPHPERSIYPWNWAYYPDERLADEVSPWVEMFVNAKEWVLGN